MANLEISCLINKGDAGTEAGMTSQNNKSDWLRHFRMLNKTAPQ